MNLWQYIKQVPWAHKMAKECRKDKYYGKVYVTFIVYPYRMFVLVTLLLAFFEPEILLFFVMFHLVVILTIMHDEREREELKQMECLKEHRKKIDEDSRRTD